MKIEVSYNCSIEFASSGPLALGVGGEKNATVSSSFWAVWDIVAMLS